MENQSFIRAIQADPDDEIPRLIYADWLDGQGDPRGELIRVQCELLRCPQGDPKRKRLDQRVSELLEDYGEAWLEPLRELGALGVSVRYFHRGMLEHLKISAEDFLEHAETLCHREPAISRVQLTNVGAHMGRLAAMQLPFQIQALDFNTNPLTPAHCQMLANSAIAFQLKELDLKFTRLEDQGVEQLLAGDWPQLKRLDLSGNRIGPGGAAALANQSGLPELEILVLSMNRLLEGAANLFTSASLSRLEELHLASNSIIDATATAMMKTRSLPALQVLNLRYNRLSQAVQRKFAKSPLGLRLKALDLTGNLVESHY